MKKIALAAAALLAASAFAQAPTPATVSSGTGATVNSSTGVAVTPGAPSAAVTVIPSTTATVPSAHLLPGGAMVERSSTTVLGGPSGDASGTKTDVRTYWVNVPANAQNRYDFQSWQSLK
jgi:hypothetical protein